LAISESIRHNFTFLMHKHTHTAIIINAVAYFLWSKSNKACSRTDSKPLQHSAKPSLPQRKSDTTTAYRNENMQQH
jgi:hypothetical protein